MAVLGYSPTPTEATMARVLISMDDGFLDMVDDFANREHRSRSELIREALRTYMRRSSLVRSPKNDEDAQALEGILSL
jgi:CopG family transcriptional regulator/antitoxin EndoAI